MKNSAVLVLADGSIFEGISVGAPGQVCGEVVFNTAQTGYQEILTDPSYTEQIIVFTQPHIGNVGVNTFDMESSRVWLSGAVMRSFSSVASNWRSEETLANFLQKHKVIAISEVDTRALTQHLRTHGSQPGCIMAGEVDLKRALHYAQNYSSMAGKNLAEVVTTPNIYQWEKGTSDNKWSNTQQILPESTQQHIVVYDFGVKHNILRYLVDLACRVTVVSANTTAEEVLALQPDGIMLSNGPGDPAACLEIIDQIKILLTKGIPIFGICLGHQLLALASGAQTKKMIFGHHGANHPVVCLATGTVAISSQNHGFVVAEETLPTCLQITHRSLFDNTIAGITRTDIPAFSFQGHPEASPGPTELTHLFNRFIVLISEVAHAKKN